MLNGFFVKFNISFTKNNINYYITILLFNNLYFKIMRKNHIYFKL